MPESVPMAKAQLQPLDAKLENTILPAHNVTVQFNPETLKVSFANQVSPSGTGDQTGTAARQVVATGTTKLSLQLYFDVTAELPAGQEQADVRKLTEKVAYFITPHKETNNLPPGVRFLWGSFKFDGVMESLEESLEFFSHDGLPLRASMSLNLTQQKITDFKFMKDVKPPPGAGPPVGTRALKAAPAGGTVQEMAAAQGKADKWQAIAAANNIENPRLLQPGQLIDMDVELPQF